MKKTFWAIVICLLAPLLASAAEPGIPAQALDISLQELSKAAGVRIVYSADLVKARQAPALNGPFSLASGLDTLLAGTNLTYHVLETGAIELAEPPMDEVTITGRQEKLSAVRKEYEKLEDEFYKEYNKLNTDHQYDVTCELEGTFMKARVCTPDFFHKAVAAQMQGALQGHASIPADMVIREKLPVYRDKMRDLVKKNPKLLELLMKRDAAAQRYQTLGKKKRESGKIFVWD